MPATIESFVEMLEHPTTMRRIVAMGSSNTQRVYNNPTIQNWVDWLDLLLGNSYGRGHIMINSGISGETTAQILKRFERDVVLFQPQLVFITAGGNDSNPAKLVSVDQYRSNLLAMVKRTRELPECVPVLQTYYSIDDETMIQNGAAEHVKNFHAYMQTVREVAKETSTPLIDHLVRWEPLRKSDVAAFRALMVDPMHMSGRGHLLFALDVFRAMGCKFAPAMTEFCKDGLALQRQLDEL
ncbi:MAG TPA: SGNH/GDSL hydrolase family protein [Planctomycetota bacterium]|nr:SGNH/GDSL hydrolase family protein [Planctomycetota bacterium]